MDTSSIRKGSIECLDEDTTKKIIPIRRMNKSGIPNRTRTFRQPPNPDCPFHVGVVADRNARKRRKMEDTHSFFFDYLNVTNQGLFCLFDGHAGAAAAKWCEEHFHEILSKLMIENEKRKMIEQYSIQALLNEAFQEVDSRLVEENGINSGCTAVICLFCPPKKDHLVGSSGHFGTLYTANTGDARAVICQGGKAIRLSYDHKSTDLHEQRRIVEAGGFVANERVVGVLAVSRALGDEELKEYIIGRPYTTKTNLTKNSEFLILACDGLWDVMNDQETVDFIRRLDGKVEEEKEKEGISSHMDPLKAAEILVDEAMARGSMDNISVMIIPFHFS